MVVKGELLEHIVGAITFTWGFYSFLWGAEETSGCSSTKSWEWLQGGPEKGGKQ